FAAEAKASAADAQSAGSGGHIFRKVQKGMVGLLKFTDEAESHTYPPPAAVHCGKELIKVQIGICATHNARCKVEVQALLSNNPGEPEARYGFVLNPDAVHGIVQSEAPLFIGP